MFSLLEDRTFNHCDNTQEVQGIPGSNQSHLLMKCPVLLIILFYLSSRHVPGTVALNNKRS